VDDEVDIAGGFVEQLVPNPATTGVELASALFFCDGCHGEDDIFVGVELDGEEFVAADH